MKPRGPVPSAAVVLGADAVRAVVVALGLLRRTYRRDGLPVPEIITRLLADLHRHGPTEQTAPVELAHTSPVLVDLTAAAHRLGVSRRTVERLVADGTLDSVTIGRARRVHLDQLDTYLATLATWRSG